MATDRQLWSLPVPTGEQQRRAYGFCLRPGVSLFIAIAPRIDGPRLSWIVSLSAPFRNPLHFLERRVTKSWMGLRMPGSRERYSKGFDSGDSRARTVSKKILISIDGSGL